MKNKYLYLASLGIFLVILICWDSFAKEPLPSLGGIYQSFIELLESGRLLNSIFDSLVRFFIGLLLGSFFATLLGLLLGRFQKIQIILEPFIQVLRPISPIAWLPLIALWFGIGEVGAIFVICYAVFFPMLLSTINGVRQIHPDLIAMAKNFQASEWLIFRKIILPGAFLHISSGLKLVASIAWIHLVAGEMLGIQSGLGYLIIDGRNLLRMDIVIIAMILIGILGFFITLLFNAIEKLIHKKLGGCK